MAKTFKFDGDLLLQKIDVVDVDYAGNDMLISNTLSLKNNSLNFSYTNGQQYYGNEIGLKVNENDSKHPLFYMQRSDGGFPDLINDLLINDYSLDFTITSIHGEEPIIASEIFSKVSNEGATIFIRSGEYNYSSNDPEFTNFVESYIGFNETIRYNIKNTSASKFYTGRSTTIISPFTFLKRDDVITNSWTDSEIENLVKITSVRNTLVGTTEPDPTWGELGDIYIQI